MYHKFCILPSVFGHLGCFHVLAVVNSAPANTGVHASLSVMVFLGFMPSNEMLGHMVVLFLVFIGISILFSIVAVSVYIPTNCARGFPYLHILPAFTVCRFFNDGHSDRVEFTPYCSFDLHLSNYE